MVPCTIKTASTEREADKELLSELLIHRIQKGENRHVRAGVSQAVKIIALHHMKKVKEVYADLMPGLIGIGIEIGSESYNKAIDILKKAQLGINSFTDHDLRDNYVRLGIIDINRLDLVVNKGEASFRDKNGMLYKIPMEFQLNDNQKQAYGPMESV